MKIAITGGSGFIGRRIISLLLSDRSPFEVDEIRNLDINESEHGPDDDRIIFVKVDIRDKQAVMDSLEGVELVFHTAAIVDWGRLSEQFVYDVNVVGTENILAAVTALDIPYLVATTTMDVAWKGEPIPAGTEELPYATGTKNAYCTTKIQAEKLVLNFGKIGRDSESAPRACVIRPMGVFGEGDPYHISQLLLSAEKGALTARMGDGSARFSHVYVDNVAWGHICAAKQLMEDKSISGEAYLIGDDGPDDNFFDFMEPIITGIGYDFPPPQKTVGYRTALWIARISQWAARLMRPIRDKPPLMTTESVKLLCLDIVFSDAKARNQLGYEPIVGPEEAEQRTIQWFREHGPVRR